MMLASIFVMFSIFYGALEWVRRRYSYDPAITRKIAHVGSALGALASYPFTSQREFILIATIFFIFFAISYRKKILTAVHVVNYVTFGELFFPIALIYMAYFFYHDPFVFITSILVLGVADPLAGYYDRSFGKKTSIGRAYFFCATVIIIAFTIWMMTPIWPGIFKILSISLIITLTEYVSLHGSDNITIPVVTSLLLISLT